MMELSESQMKKVQAMELSENQMEKIHAVWDLPSPNTTCVDEAVGIGTSMLNTCVSSNS